MKNRRAAADAVALLLFYERESMVNPVKRHIVLLLLVIAVLTSSAFAEEAETGSYVLEYDPLTQMQMADVMLADTDPVAFSGTSYGSALKNADPDVYKIYAAIEDAVTKGVLTTNSGMTGYKVSLNLSGVDEPEKAIYTALAAYDNDHPYETSVLTGAFLRSYNYSWILLECFDSASIETRLEQLNHAVYSFQNEYEKDKMDSDSVTDIQRYRYIHDYLCSKLSYNYDALEWTQGTSQFENAHSAYGALVGLYEQDGYMVGRGSVVCQGYSDAFLLLCQSVDLPCVVIIGEGRNDGRFTGYANHMWNAVLVDEDWYCIDVTWDDIDKTIYDDTVEISTNYYDYFLDNRYFFAGTGEVTRDHAIYTQSNYPGASVTIGAPAMTYTQRVDTTTLVPEEITLCLYPAEGSEIAQMASVIEVISGWGSGELHFNMIPTVNIILTCDTEVSATCRVPDGRVYWVMSNNDDVQYTLTRTDDFTGNIFYVESQGEMLLFDLNLQGDAKGSALIVSEDAYRKDGEINSAYLYLNDVTVTGNQNAFGMDVDATVVVDGMCVMNNNTIAGEAANLNLREYGYVAIYDLETDSKIGITTPANSFFAFAVGEWTESNKNAFFSDDPSLTIVFDPTDDGWLCCSSVNTTEKTMPVYITYTAMPSVAAVSDHPVTLSNTTEEEKQIVLYAAMYQEEKLVFVQTVYTGTLEVGATTESIHLPEAPDGTDTYKLFVMNSDLSIPVSEALVLT